MRLRLLPLCARHRAKVSGSLARSVARFLARSLAPSTARKLQGTKQAPTHASTNPRQHQPTQAPTHTPAGSSDQTFVRLLGEAGKSWGGATGRSLAENAKKGVTAMITYVFDGGLPMVQIIRGGKEEWSKVPFPPTRADVWTTLRVEGS